jgi:predicted  nucleic acid-binding Zn-ribbon protein
VTDQARERKDLLIRRLALIGKVSEGTAEALRLQQALAAAEMDILRCQLAIQRGDARRDVSQELQDSMLRLEALTQAASECDSRLDSLETEVFEIDRRIAAPDLH